MQGKYRGDIREILIREVKGDIGPPSAAARRAAVVVREVGGAVLARQPGNGIEEGEECARH